MCIPGLHITLGVYLKIFNMFEMLCRRIDVIISGGDIEKTDKLEELEIIFDELQSQKENIEQVFDWNIIKKNLTNTDELAKR